MEECTALRPCFGARFFQDSPTFAVLTFSIAAIQAGPSTKIQAIKDCRAELGEHAKYMEVRACVLREMKGE